MRILEQQRVSVLGARIHCVDAGNTHSEAEKKKKGDVSRNASAILMVQASSPNIVGRIA